MVRTKREISRREELLSELASECQSPEESIIPRRITGLYADLPIVD
ncbi:hypothetical protein [Stieleria marina]|uniref:Uncharacterized protein n=1 Tax=Stieleria marina TaxID=1930275 RepID=A0A517NWQ2_9BACT|nr:hypothetical protein K239x_35650 [Planctomycetes bacterium K23_9]